MTDQQKETLEQWAKRVAKILDDHALRNRRCPSCLARVAGTGVRQTCDKCHDERGMG